MNKFIKAIKELDLTSIKTLFQKEPKWTTWAEEDGKNALHYLGAVCVKDPEEAETSIQLFKLFLKNGMDINAVHKIPDPNCEFFPATPLWYAYTRGRNEKLYTWLLKNGANPEHCMYAIAWYDDSKGAALFKKHGAGIDNNPAGDTPFMAAWNWKKFHVAEWFLKNGANINYTDVKGNTVLHYALKKKYNPEQVKLLLKYGADINKANKEGISPKKMAESKRDKTIINLFK